MGERTVNDSKEEERVFLPSKILKNAFIMIGWTRIPKR